MVEIPPGLPPDAAVPIESLSPLAERYSTEDEQSVVLVREQTRTVLAVIFAVIFALVLVIAGAGAFTTSWANLMEFLELALPAVTALLGSAVGFYFGTQTQQR